jgi:phosphoglycerate kinase
MNKLSIKDLDLKGKRVFIRVDFNVPLDEEGHVTNDARIQASLPTIRYALSQNGRVVLASHLGRPKGKVNPKMGLKPVAAALGRLLGQKIQMASSSPLFVSCMSTMPSAPPTVPTLPRWG